MNKLKFVKFKDLFICFLLIIAFFPAMIAKIFIRNFWLVCEDKNEARDNGYWFFKYVRENHKEQKIAYAINKKSPDYQKVKNLGKVISFGSLSHWFWYLVADKNISSQKNGKPNAAWCYLFEVVFKFRKKNRVFLQHGIIINDLKFLHYKNTNMFQFCVSTPQEKQFLDENFGYPDGAVQLTGLARFDNLLNFEVNENQILVMPTWRQWIAKEVEMQKIEGTTNFLESNYFKHWSEFLKSEKLAALLKKYKKQLIFYPHRNMQKYLENFKSDNENIVIASSKDYDVQDLLKTSALLVTDYSSVFFDFAYMKKPIIFYQFDEKAFRANQYTEGYFSYKDNGFSDWCEDSGTLLKNLELSLKNDLKLKNENAVDKYFPSRDNKNCERIFKMIKSNR